MGLFISKIATFISIREFIEVFTTRMSMGDSFKYSNHVCLLGIYLSMCNIYVLCVIHFITHSYV